MNPKNRKLVYGVGINDANYVVRRQNSVCPYYRVWESVIMRCYSNKYRESTPTYKDCTVSEEWLTFSTFAAWMEKQPWEGFQLDTGILIEGNKHYSADTCVFISRLVKRFTNDRKASRGDLLIGAYQCKRTGKFIASCSNPFTGKGESLGSFDSEQEAHQAWVKRKLELAQELTFFITDQRVANALIDRYLPQIRD